MGWLARIRLRNKVKENIVPIIESVAAQNVSKEAIVFLATIEFVFKNYIKSVDKLLELARRSFDNLIISQMHEPLRSI